jgi:DNA modification methylase
MAVKQVSHVSFDGLTLDEISKQYILRNKMPIPFDFKKAVRRDLQIENSSIIDAHYTHYYPGRIFPYIPMFMLSLSDFEVLKGPILDPFAGSGTILLESVRNPVLKRTAIGVEKNPIGRLISKVKTRPLNIQTVNLLLEQICLEYKRAKNINSLIPEFRNRSLWFSDKAFKKLSRLKYAIRIGNFNSDYEDFFWLCYSSIIRKVSKANPYIPPPVTLKPEKYSQSSKTYEKLKAILKESEDPEVLDKFIDAVVRNSQKLSSLNNNEALKNGSITSNIVWDDARGIMKGSLLTQGRLQKNRAQILEPNSIGLAITSPPYLTAQKYIRTNKLELFCLGYSEDEVLAIEKTSIGTERVGLKTNIFPIGVDSIDKEVSSLQSISIERAVQVFQYFKDMMDTLHEINRVLRKNAFAVLVVGDNRVINRNVETSRLLVDAAITWGFEEIVILKDTIRARSMLTKRNGTGGIIKNEFVIVLKKVG